MNKNLYVYLATLGPIGYSMASGTVATFFTLPCVYLCKTTLSWWAYVIFVIFASLLAVRIITRALEYFGDDEDPAEIVIDEFIGCLTTFCFVPLNLHTIILGFLLFRFFDISKWFGINRIEQYKGAWGIALDDIVAGIYANITIHIFYVQIFGPLC